jgi:predicted RNA-binding protein with RPS1 domain
MSNGNEYAIGSVLEGTVQCVKSFRVFIDIRKDIGMLHINEVSHAYVKTWMLCLLWGEQ